MAKLIQSGMRKAAMAVARKAMAGRSVITENGLIFQGGGIYRLTLPDHFSVRGVRGLSGRRAVFVLPILPTTRTPKEIKQ